MSVARDVQQSKTLFGALAHVLQDTDEEYRDILGLVNAVYSHVHRTKRLDHAREAVMHQLAQIAEAHPEAQLTFEITTGNLLPVWEWFLWSGNFGPAAVDAANAHEDKLDAEERARIEEEEKRLQDELAGEEADERAAASIDKALRTAVTSTVHDLVVDSAEDFDQVADEVTKGLAQLSVAKPPAANPGADYIPAVLALNKARSATDASLADEQ
jgi:hypothetical protein